MDCAQVNAKLPWTDQIIDHAKTIGKLTLPVVIDWGARIYTLKNSVPQFKELYRFASTLLSGNGADIKKCCSNMSTSTKSCFNQSTQQMIGNIARADTGLPTTEHIQTLTCEVAQCQDSFARQLIWTEVIGSGLVILSQGVSLWQVGNELTAAKNLCSSSVERAQEIKKKLDGLQEKFDVLTAFIDEYKTAEEVTLIDLMDIQAKIRDIDAVLRNVSELMGELKLDVNGKIVSLKGIKNELVKEGVVAAAQVVAHLAEFAVFGANMSNAVRSVKGVFTAIFAGLVAAKTAQYVLSNDRLNDLHKIWVNIKELDEFRQKLEATADEAQKWLAGHIRELQRLAKQKKAN